MEGPPCPRFSSVRSAPSPTRPNCSAERSTNPSPRTASTGTGPATSTSRCSVPTAAPHRIADYAQSPRRRRRRRGRARDEVGDLPGTAGDVRRPSPARRRSTRSRKPSARDHKLAFVTTTSQGNIDALLAALRPHISAEMFDLIVNGDSVNRPKPDAAAYTFALEQLSEDARLRGRDRRQRRRRCGSDGRGRHLHRVPEREHRRCRLQRRRRDGRFTRRCPRPRTYQRLTCASRSSHIRPIPRRSQ